MVIAYDVSTNPVDNPLKYLYTLLLTSVYICIHCQQGFIGTSYAPTPCMGYFWGLGMVLYVVVCHPGGMPEVVVFWHKVAYHIRGCSRWVVYLMPKVYIMISTDLQTWNQPQPIAHPDNRLSAQAKTWLNILVIGIFLLCGCHMFLPFRILILFLEVWLYSIICLINKVL